jgi:glucose/mannose transport system permease protein
MPAGGGRAAGGEGPGVRKRRRIKKDTLLALLLISPSVVAVAIFVYGFIGWSFRVSLSRWQGLTPDYTWAGLSNYGGLLHDARFHIDVRNTLIFTAFFLTGAIVIGLVTAILLDQRVPGEAWFRAVYLFPMAISFIVTGVAWRWLMNPAAGTRTSGLNLLFEKVGLGFLANSWHTTPPPWGIAFIAIPAVWQMSGFMMALFLGGLRSIPDDLREAARVDGASELQTYRHVILPMLRPVVLSAIIILGHISLKIFDLIVAMSGKDIRLDVPAIYMWTATFDANNFAVGATIGILLLIGVAALVVPYLIYSLRGEAKV